MKIFSIFLLCAALADAECVAVAHERILAKDLAPAVPMFQALDPETALGFAPLAGTRRVFSGHELRLIARQHSIDAPEAGVPDLCVTRLVTPLLREQIEKALEKSLAMPDARIEILDFSSQPLPLGALEFRLSGLARPPAAQPENPVIWRGRLVYDGNRSASIWAKVRISVERTWLVAAEDIAARQPIRSEQIRTESNRVFPFPATEPLSADSVAGKLAQRTIHPGQRIAANALQDAPDVTRGETVRVNVTEGLASLTLDAVARSGGRKGDVILLHNPSTGRDFQAVIADKGQATAPPPRTN
jgi:flagella basal body P-ring formation protein FlgA